MRRLQMVVLALIALPVPAGAQMSFAGPLSSGSFEVTLNQGPIANTLRQQMSTPGETQRRMRLQPDRAGSGQVAAMTFTPSRARRATNLAAFVAKSRKVDPQGAARMEQIFRSTDVIGEIDQRMRQSYGMRANDVADAYAVWWTSAWLGAHGRTDDPTPHQMAMVRWQAADALSATPQFVGASAAAKQELAESLLVQASLIGATVDTYKNDRAMLAKAQAAIAQGARATGIDLGSMILTDEGFVPVGRKTGALNSPVAGEEPRRADIGNGVLIGAALLGMGAGGLWLIKDRRSSI